MVRGPTYDNYVVNLQSGIVCRESSVATLNIRQSIRESQFTHSMSWIALHELYVVNGLSHIFNLYILSDCIYGNLYISGSIYEFGADCQNGRWLSIWQLRMSLSIILCWEWVSVSNSQSENETYINLRMRILNLRMRHVSISEWDCLSIRMRLSQSQIENSQNENPKSRGRMRPYKARNILPNCLPAWRLKQTIYENRGTEQTALHP